MKMDRTLRFGIIALVATGYGLLAYGFLMWEIAIFPGR